MALQGVSLSGGPKEPVQVIRTLDPADLMELVALREVRLHVPDRLDVGHWSLRNLNGAHRGGERAGAPVLQVQAPVLDEAGELRRHLRDGLHPLRCWRCGSAPCLCAVAATQRRRPDDEEDAFGAAGPVQHRFSGASRFLCVQFGVVQVASPRPIRRLGFRSGRP